MAIVAERYADFDPTLVADKLADLHRIAQQRRRSGS
jgi:hypothetical protein